MSDNDTQNTFANFMKPKNGGEDKSSSYIAGSNKTKESLKKARDDKEEEEKKELYEAKKNSMALANRYGKSDMMKMQAKNIIVLIPFIALGAFIVLMLIFKGGAIASAGLNFLFNKITTGK